MQLYTHLHTYKYYLKKKTTTTTTDLQRGPLLAPTLHMVLVHRAPATQQSPHRVDRVKDPEQTGEIRMFHHQKWEMVATSDGGF